MRRFVLISLFCGAVLFLAGCSYFDMFLAPTSSTEEESQVATGGYVQDELPAITLPAYTADSFSPYQAQSLVNLNLMPLLYESLVRITPAYTVEYRLAETVSVSGLTCRVTLRENAVFSNGEPVTADDLLYSVAQALSVPDSYYGKRLENLAGVEKDGSDTVVFSLKSPDQLFAYTLDFPVVQSGSAGEQEATGGGRYILRMQNNQYYLEENPNRLFADTEPLYYDRIGLLTVPDEGAMISSVAAGTLSAMYTDLSGGSISGVGAALKYVPSNNLFYLGIGKPLISEGTTLPEKTPEQTLLENADFRQALSLLMDRNLLLSQAFGGHGESVTIPFPPAFTRAQSDGDDPLFFSSEADLEAAGLLLDQAGLSGRDPETGLRALPDGTLPTFEILYPAGNSAKALLAAQITAALKSAGLSAKATELTFAAYSERIAAGTYHLYVGEVRLNNRPGLEAFLGRAVGAEAENTETPVPESLLTGLNQTVTDAYRSFLEGRISFDEFAAVFLEETPFIPLFFRSHAVVYHRDLKTEMQTSVSDVYYNIGEWS